MVRALPDDGKRYELVHGELLVTPAPRAVHQAAVGALHLALSSACRRSGRYRVWLSPADISWGPDTLVQPDVFVVPAAESDTMDWTRMRTLVLVAEVLSPSTARQDRDQKRRLYQAQGVRTLWLVDPDARRVEVWTPEAHFPVVETERVTWDAGDGAEPVVISIAELFR
jgi:Uma2 family endonuclease